MAIYGVEQRCIDQPRLVAFAIEAHKSVDDAKVVQPLMDGCTALHHRKHRIGEWAARVVGHNEVIGAMK